ncbi:MAG: hypothetical protein KOO63_05755 [Bacteroidales bacterium]|nr:hypothetical protein [Candidatus Latescibacterota bacterium]
MEQLTQEETERCDGCGEEKTVTFLPWLYDIGGNEYCLCADCMEAMPGRLEE